MGTRYMAMRLWYTHEMDGHLQGPAPLVHRLPCSTHSIPKPRRQQGQAVPGAVPARRCSHLVLLEQEGRSARRAIAGAVQGRAGDDPLDELVDELESKDNGANAGEPLEAHVVLQVHPPKRNADGHAQHESAPQPQAGSGPQCGTGLHVNQLRPMGRKNNEVHLDCYQSRNVQLYITRRISSRHCHRQLRTLLHGISPSCLAQHSSEALTQGR
jgi:hypothetical protein